jgi:hypothetical protein
MDVTDNNFTILIGYLQNTLNPDPAVRRPGKKFLIIKDNNIDF